MTNGERIRNMSDAELAQSKMLRCEECVYLPFVKAEDPWHCVKLGWMCEDGKKRWLGQEAK